MEETFEIYDKRTVLYKIISFIIYPFFVFIFIGIFFPEIISKAPQLLIIIWFFLGFITTMLSMFIGGMPIKTYTSSGCLILTDISITINENVYLLNELLSVETNAGGYKGLGTRGGLNDGTGNKIMLKTNDGVIVEERFVVISKAQRDNLTQILKCWRANGVKIISNGIDLL